MKNTENMRLLAAAAARAEAALAKPGAVYTAGARYGVEDMLARAKSVLAGRYTLPFARSMRFVPDNADPAAFVLRFHTMITTWQRPGDMERTYGMADAADWLETQDMAAWPANTLRAAAAGFAARARAVLARMTPGTALGNADPAAYAELQAAACALDGWLAGAGHAGAENPASLAARCADAVRECLASQVLVFDRAGGTLFQNTADAAALPKKLRQDEFLRGRCAAIKAIADESTPAGCAGLAALSAPRVDFDAANKQYYLWSTSEKALNFTTPANAVTATLAITLPGCENEAEVLGHVWLDELRIFGANGSDWPIENPGFEIPGAGALPAGWQSLCTGGGTARREDAYPWRGLGKGSLRLENATPVGQAGVVSATPFAVPGNTGNTITFMVKIDGKLKTGVVLTLHFYDAAGRPAGDWRTVFNRTSALYLGVGPAKGYSLYCQADAIVYAATGDRAYAQKAKEGMLFELNRFCQGAEHWMLYNCRPHGCDAYGAVQAGRILCSAAACYTLIAHSGVFTEAETASLLAMAQYMTDYCTDARDRTALSSEQLLHGAGNWQTDMETGAAVMALALLGAGVLDAAGQKKARYTLQNAVCFLEAQLHDSVNPDGSFPESLRYHMSAMMRYTMFAGILSNCTGVDWYKTTPLKAMFRCYADMITPDYAFFGGRPSTPTFGDHNLDDGSAFLQFGLHAAEVARTDPALAQKLLDIWHRAGCPAGGFGTEDVAFTRLLMCTDAIPGQTPGGWEPLRSNRDYPDSGITIFRKGFHTPREQYLAVMASPRVIGHGHFDEGSFIYYKDSVPVIADPGIIGYFDASKDWLVSSSAHACLQFASRDGKLEKAELRTDRLDESLYSRLSGYLDTPRTAKVLGAELGGAAERLAIEIDNPEGEGVHRRQIFWFPEPELILVRDTVQAFAGTVRFTLPIACQKTEQVSETEFLSACNYGLHLQTIFAAAPGALHTALEWGVCKTCAPAVDGRDVLQYLRAEGAAQNGFTVLLNATRPGEPAAAVRQTPAGLTIQKGNWEKTLVL